MSRIMIVDDDPDILKYCETILSAKGHEVLTSNDAMQALELLRVQATDLLVIDIMMPRMNGFELLKALKHIRMQTPPVLMLTARNATKDVKEALDLGATDYMVKPFDRDVFLAKVESILGMRAPSPEVQFARTSANARAVVGLNGLVTSVTEMGLTLRTHTYLDRNVRIEVFSPIFAEIGIQAPPLRAGGCKPIENDAEYNYEVFVSFVGLDEMAMKKIRKWVQDKAIAARKAG